MIISGVDGGCVVSRASCRSVLFSLPDSSDPTTKKNFLISVCVAECHGVYGCSSRKKKKTFSVTGRFAVVL